MATPRRTFIDLDNARVLEAGLLNDHYELEINEFLNSISEVGLAYNPWSETRQLLKSDVQLHAHQMRILGAQSDLPTLQLWLPERLHVIECDIWLSKTLKAIAQIIPLALDSVEDIDRVLAARITKFLFRTALVRRLPNLDSADYALPYYLTPDRRTEELETWLTASQRANPLGKYPLEPASTFVIQRWGQVVPYFFTTSHNSTSGILDGDGEIQTTKLSRRLDFSVVPPGPEPQPQNCKVSECTVISLSPGYVRLMAFIPTIMHRVELALRAYRACQGVLYPVGFTSPRHVLTALTAPGAGPESFQRLEYLGDTLLKYHSTINVFCENPQMPESQLTFLENQIVNNKRLQKSTMNLGLDAFISTMRFSAHHWTLKDTSKEQQTKTRSVSNKTLADVIESLIGAAHVDDLSSPSDNPQSKTLRALSLFLPEVPWKSPEEHIANLIIPDSDSFAENTRLSSVEEIIHYKFRNRSLLAEALTHSTLKTKVRSYERLEFLGDAVIDVIVKPMLFRSEYNFEEGEMHTRHIALVNKDILAYLAIKNGVDVLEKKVFAGKHGKVVVEERMTKKRLLDFVTRVNVSGEMGTQRKGVMQRFESLQEGIERTLREGGKYPWTELYSLNLPKWWSDIIESIIGAVFVDSSANLVICTEVLSTLGLMDLLQRAVSEKEMDFEQPARKVRERSVRGGGEEKGKWWKIESKQFRDGWACRIKIGDEVKVVISGCECAAEAESRAAEILLENVKRGEVELEGNEDGKGDDVEMVTKGEWEGEDKRESGNGIHGDYEESVEVELEQENDSKKRKRESTYQMT